MNASSTDAAEPAAVTPLSDQEERDLLAAVQRTPYAAVLSVSDLHLGMGRDEDTQRYGPRENFLADGAFSRFLANQVATTPGPRLLVLNGDIIDFLRVTAVPDQADVVRWAALLTRLDRPGSDVPTLEASFDRHERDYGLQTDDYKSVWKLMVVAAGHPGFFSALASWIRRGGTIVYTLGNHDPEQFWPLVRRCLREMLRSYGASADDLVRRVAFADSWMRVANVVFEHGHMYERMTAIVGPPVLKGTRQLNLPLGSLVNRYVVNNLESISPFLDNITPVLDVVLAAVKQHPVELWTLVRRSSVMLFRALRRRRGGAVLLAASLIMLALSQAAPLALVIGGLLYISSPGFRDMLTHTSSVLRFVIGALGLLGPVIGRKVARLLDRRHYPEGEDDCAGGAFFHLPQRIPDPSPWQTVYVVVGHTHKVDVQCLKSVNGSARTIYLNTGTWIPRWPRERPDLIGRVLYTLVRFTYVDGVYGHEILAWDDEAGCVREAIILAS